jgi:hypothetical protein
MTRLVRYLSLCAALSGCATGKFDNLITMSLTGDRAFVSSLYGPVGITAELREADAKELQAMKEKAAAAEQLVLMLQIQAAQRAKGAPL